MPTVVEVSANILHWPDRCACCGGRSNTTYAAKTSRTSGKRVVRTETKGWHVPYCRACAKHVNAHAAAASMGSVALLAAIVAVIAFAAKAIDVSTVASGIGGVFFLLAAFSFSRSTKLACRSCGSIAPAIRYKGWHGTFHAFEFENPDYADAFLDANRKKVMGFSGDGKWGRNSSPGAITCGVLATACAVFVVYTMVTSERRGVNPQIQHTPIAQPQELKKDVAVEPIKLATSGHASSLVSTSIILLGLSYAQLENNRVAREKVEADRIEEIRLAKIRADKEAADKAAKAESDRKAAEAKKARDEVEAQKLYDKITARVHLLELIEKYPDTAAAAKARERLAKLDKK